MSLFVSFLTFTPYYLHPKLFFNEWEHRVQPTCFSNGRKIAFNLCIWNCFSLKILHHIFSASHAVLLLLLFYYYVHVTHLCGFIFFTFVSFHLEIENKASFDLGPSFQSLCGFSVRIIAGTNDRLRARCVLSWLSGTRESKSSLARRDGWLPKNFPVSQ